MIKINDQTIQPTIDKAQSSPRKRMNYNYHPELSDPLQRMLNAIEPGTYVQPHKHENPDKTEVFMVLKGKIAVLEFDDEGKVIDSIILDPQKGQYAAEIPPRTWHSIISLEKGSVAYEIKNGPYVQIEDKNFADWAPKEGDAEVEEYLQELISCL
jgi:cupin fold WbuC family metalloprotein